MERGDGRRGAALRLGGAGSAAGTSDGAVAVELDERERPDPTGCLPERVVGQGSTGTSASRWAGAIGWVAGLEEATERRRQRERDHAAAGRRDRDLGPRSGGRARVVGVLERLGS